MDANNKQPNDSGDFPDITQQEALLLQQQQQQLQRHHQQELATAATIDIEISPEQQRRQPSRLQQIVHQLSKRKIKAFIYNWRWYLALLVFIIISSAFMVAHRRQFLQALETFSDKLTGMGYSGYILLSVLIFSSAFPPILGYSTYQTLSGFTFGFSIGFPISYFSALAGAVVCFQLSRTFLKARVVQTLSKYPNLEAAVKAVEKKGFRLFLLIRFSPYPFNLLNVLFAATNISLFQFAAGTGISLLKIALHVYIGANLTSFAKHVLGEDQDLSESEQRVMKIRFAAAIFFSLLAFVVMGYLYRVAKAAIAETAATDEEQMSFLNHQDEEEGLLDAVDDGNNSINESTLQVNTNSVADEPRESVSLDAWDAWGDDDDNH
ncbi:snare associated Golgi protein-domain-containing protein [Parasitella parasitica]|nr:snare associated Golgi protein-domain-containing protein [Parasitella parasitica]